MSDQTNLSELLVAMHADDGVGEVGGVEIIVGEGEDAGGAVVHHVEEDAVVGATAHDLPGPHALHAFDVTAQHLQEVLGGHVIACVVLRDALVHVGSSGSVDDDTWRRVPVTRRQRIVRILYGSRGRTYCAYIFPVRLSVNSRLLVFTHGCSPTLV